MLCRYNRPDSRFQPSREPPGERPPAFSAPSGSNRRFYSVLKRVLPLQSSRFPVSAVPVINFSRPGSPVENALQHSVVNDKRADMLTGVTP